MNNEKSYSNYVIVHGFSMSSQSQYDAILSLFGSFGSIVSRYPEVNNSSKSNWICLQYQSSLEAEKAISQNGLFLELGMDLSSEKNVIIVGAIRMNSVIAKKLAIGTSGFPSGEKNTSVPDLFEDSTAPVKENSGLEADHCKSGRAHSLFDPSNKLDALLTEDDVLLSGRESERNEVNADTLVPGRRYGDGSFCDKVLTWIFQW